MRKLERQTGNRICPVQITTRGRLACQTDSTGEPLLVDVVTTSSKQKHLSTDGLSKVAVYSANKLNNNNKGLPFSR